MKLIFVIPPRNYTYPDLLKQIGAKDIMISYYWAFISSKTDYLKIGAKHETTSASASKWARVCKTRNRLKRTD